MEGDTTKASSSKHPRGCMGKLEYLGKTPIVGRRENPIDINLNEGFIAIKAQQIKTTRSSGKQNDHDDIFIKK